MHANVTLDALHAHSDKPGSGPFLLACWLAQFAASLVYQADPSGEDDPSGGVQVHDDFELASDPVYYEFTPLKMDEDPAAYLLRQARELLKEAGKERWLAVSLYGEDGDMLIFDLSRYTLPLQTFSTELSALQLAALGELPGDSLEGKMHNLLETAFGMIVMPGLRSSTVPSISSCSPRLRFWVDS